MQKSYTNIAVSFEPDYNFVGSNGYALEGTEIDFNRETEYIYRDSDEW